MEINVTLNKLMPFLWNYDTKRKNYGTLGMRQEWIYESSHHNCFYCGWISSLGGKKKTKGKELGSFWINVDLMKRAHWLHRRAGIPTVLNKQFSANNSSAFVSPLWNSDYRRVTKPTGFTTKTQRRSFYHKDQDNNCVPTRKEQLKPCNRH